MLQAEESCVKVAAIRTVSAIYIAGLKYTAIYVEYNEQVNDSRYSNFKEKLPMYSELG